MLFSFKFQASPWGQSDAIALGRCTKLRRSTPPGRSGEHPICKRLLLEQDGTVTGGGQAEFAAIPEDGAGDSGKLAHTVGVTVTDAVGLGAGQLGLGGGGAFGKSGGVGGVLALDTSGADPVDKGVTLDRRVVNVIAATRDDSAQNNPNHDDVFHDGNVSRYRAPLNPPAPEPTIVVCGEYPAVTHADEVGFFLDRRCIGRISDVLHPSKIGSSPESMGEKDRLRKLDWPMKQGSFERIEGTFAQCRTVYAVSRNQGIRPSSRGVDATSLCVNNG